MHAGEFNKIIQIAKKTVELGEYTDHEVYQVVKTTKACVRHLNGGRDIQNSEIFYSDQVQFIIRYYHDIDDEDHIIYDGREYRITNIFRDSDSTVREIQINAELVNK